MGEHVLCWITAGDPLMTQVHALRHEVLFAPFGLPRDDAWGDEGPDRLHLVVLSGTDGPDASAPRPDGTTPAADTTTAGQRELVGYTSMLLEPDGSAHLRQVCVRADCQRAGVGRALMLEAEAEARRRGMPLVWLQARVAAEGFYHRLGYGTVSDVFAFGRTGVPHVRMEKRLDG